MGVGDLYTIETGECTDLFYVDVGMYDTEEYGSVYILDAERPAVIDTGTGLRFETVLDAIESVGIARAELAVIAPTHVHLDHAGGAGYLARECPNAEIVIHERGTRHLVDPARLVAGTKAAVGDMWEHYRDPLGVPKERIRSLTDGDCVDLGDHTLRTHYTPGHAPHHVVFEDPANSAIFAADAAGIYVPSIDAVRPTTPPPDFDLVGCLADLELLQSLDPDMLLYSHYGPAPADERLQEYAEVLINWVERIEIAREGKGDDAVIEQFVQNTTMDEVWGEERANAETAMNTRGVLQYLDERE